MIVRSNKGYETNKLFPKTDWYNENNYVVDETTEKGKILAQKIKDNYPNYELVVEDGELIDVKVLPQELNYTLTTPEPAETEILFAEYILQNEEWKESLTTN